MTDLKHISSTQPSVQLPRPSLPVGSQKQEHASIADQAVHDVLHPMRVRPVTQHLSLSSFIQEDYFDKIQDAVQGTKQAFNELHAQQEMPPKAVLQEFEPALVGAPQLSAEGIDDQKFAHDISQGVQLSAKDYTRTDLVVYASQFVSSYMGAFDELFQTISKSAGEQLQGKPELNEQLQAQFTIMRSVIIKKFAEMLREIPLNPAISGISPEESARYLELESRYDSLSNQEKGELAQLEKKVNDALATSIAYSKEQKKFFDSTKKAIHVLQEEAQNLSQKCLKSCRALLEVEGSIKVPAVEHKVVERANQLRAEMIHARKEWNLKKATEFVYAIKGMPNESGEVPLVGMKSSFLAAGPAYSSAMPRNRTHTTSCVANFFKTEAAVVSDQMSPFDPCLATRSAIPVEFSQDDARERSFCTQKHLRQIAEAHAESQVQKALKSMPEGQLKALREGKLAIPIKVNYSTLLSPDVGRQVLGMMNRMPLADNERVLLDETLAAADLVNKQTGHILIDDPENPGKKIEVKIGYDIRIMNFPGNKLYDTYKMLPGISRLVRHSRAEEETNQSINLMLGDAQVAQKKLIAIITTEIANIPENEQAQVKLLQSLVEASTTSRMQLSNYVRANKKMPSSSALQEWQMQADKRAKLLKGICEGNGSDELKALASSVLKHTLLQDLAADIQDLQVSGLYDNPELFGGNRYALNSRILMLSSLVGVGTHFGCRSGKDRTGLLDDQLKLLYGVTATSYRLISFVEEHTHPNYVANRLTVVESAGNASFNTKANLGGVPWWTIGGCRLDVGTSEEEKRLSKAFDEKQSASKLFERPKIKGMFTPAAQRAAPARSDIAKKPLLPK